MVEDFREQKKRKLIEARNNILRMSNNRLRAEKLDAYFNLLEYYESTITPGKVPCVLSLEEAKETYGDIYLDFDNTLKHRKIVLRESMKDCYDIFDNALPLYHKFRSIIQNFKDNNFDCTKVYTLPGNKNHKKMMGLLHDFFKQLDPVLFDIYTKIFEDGSVFDGIVEGNYVGIAYNSIPIDDGNVIVGYDKKKFDYYLTLVHEVGHLFQFYLQRNARVLSSMNPFDEVSSHLLEKLFLDYLRDNYTEDNFEVCRKDDLLYYLNELSSSKIIFKMIVNKNIKRIDYYRLDYDCYVPAEKRDEEMLKDCGDILRSKDKIPNVNFSDMDEMTFKTKKEFSKYQEKLIEQREEHLCSPVNQSFVELDDIKYSIGKSIAIYFEDKMNSNYRKGWNEYKEFITSLPSISMKDVMEKYLDTDLINNHVKTIIKSYH